MRDVITHRGPDDEGLFIDGAVGLGHRRLSIVDVASGHQPMTNEDGTLHITYNGEIYNHADFRAELEARGHVYRTHCDTETILHLYEEHGADCVEHLRGMFAFAIWDQRRRELFIARDRLGVKPLYYFHAGDGSLYFGSEIKTLFAAGASSRKSISRRCRTIWRTTLPPAKKLCFGRQAFAAGSHLAVARWPRRDQPLLGCEFRQRWRRGAQRSGLH